MFSIKKYELVKALHESAKGYDPSMNSMYDNNVGTCYERFFVAGCLYENGEIQIPCFGCYIYYDVPHCSHCVKCGACE